MDVLTSALLIPQLLLHRNMKSVGIPNGIPILNRLWRRDEYDAFVRMCGIMGVSKQAMAYRMERLGLIGENHLKNPYQMLDIYPDEEGLT